MGSGLRASFAVAAALLLSPLCVFLRFHDASLASAHALALGGALLTSPASLHDGMREIGRTNARGFAAAHGFSACSGRRAGRRSVA